MRALARLPALGILSPAPAERSARQGLGPGALAVLDGSTQGLGTAWIGISCEPTCALPEMRTLFSSICTGTC